MPSRPNNIARDRSGDRLQRAGLGFLVLTPPFLLALAATSAGGAAGQTGTGIAAGVSCCIAFGLSRALSRIVR